MYKAFSSGLLGFPGRSLKDDIPLAVKYGYEGIIFDIKNESAAFPPPEFTGLLAKSNLKPAGFGLPLEFRKDQDLFESGLKALGGYCAFARETGTTCCNTWIRSWSDTLDYKANFALHKERLTPVAETLAGYGIRLGLEFVGPPSVRKGKAYDFIHNLDGIMELISAIGTPNLGLLMDVFHWDLAGQVFADFKKIPGPEWVTMVHINDAPRGRAREEQMDQERELPGATGVLRIAEFMKGLGELNYSGPVAVEPFSAALRAMPFEEAVKTAKASTDKVWLR